MITLNGTSTQEFDAKLAGLWGDLAKASAEVTRYMRAMHRAAGDRETGYGRDRSWGMTDAEVIELFRTRRSAALPAGGDLVTYGSDKPRTYATALGEYILRRAAAAEIEGQIAGMNATYAQAPWQRYFLCRANNGHIHATLSGCFTVKWDTVMEWRPELSGHTVAEAVQALGERLCTHCFPDAPAEWTDGELRETR